MEKPFNTSQSLGKWKNIFKDKTPVLIDTNFFVICFEKQININYLYEQGFDRPYILLLLNCVHEELGIIKKRKKNLKTLDLFAEQVAQTFPEDKYFSGFPKQVDEKIIYMAECLKDFNPFIATGDKEMQKKALTKGFPVILIKNKFLKVINPGEL